MSSLRVPVVVFDFLTFVPARDEGGGRLSLNSPSVRGLLRDRRAGVPIVLRCGLLPYVGLLRNTRRKFLKLVVSCFRERSRGFQKLSGFFEVDIFWKMSTCQVVKFERNPRDLDGFQGVWEYFGILVVACVCVARGTLGFDAKVRSRQDSQRQRRGGRD
jgi:hypothetical protein